MHLEYEHLSYAYQMYSKHVLQTLILSILASASIRALVITPTAPFSYTFANVCVAMAPSQSQNQLVVNNDRGDTTSNVRELMDRPSYKYPHLRHLYLWLSVGLVVQATNDNE